MNYLVWSNQHRMWWKANRCGYTPDRDTAGRYTRAEADAIVKDATVDGHITHVSPTGIRYADEIVVADS